MLLICLFPALNDDMSKAGAHVAFGREGAWYDIATYAADHPFFKVVMEMLWCVGGDRN